MNSSDFSALSEQPGATQHTPLSTIDAEPAPACSRPPGRPLGGHVGWGFPGFDMSILALILAVLHCPFDVTSCLLHLVGVPSRVARILIAHLAAELPQSGVWIPKPIYVSKGMTDRALSRRIRSLLAQSQFTGERCLILVHCIENLHGVARFIDELSRADRFDFSNASLLVTGNSDSFASRRIFGAVTEAKNRTLECTKHLRFGMYLEEDSRILGEIACRRYFSHQYLSDSEPGKSMDGYARDEIVDCAGLHASSGGKHHYACPVCIPEFTVARVLHWANHSTFALEYFAHEAAAFLKEVGYPDFSPSTLSHHLESNLLASYSDWAEVQENQPVTADEGSN
ncbi:hypothetical protein WN982_40010 [Paraburkholderia sp. IMGN_8]|uniref:hypothetical protein n=1 Tax=Paraburkholderia sp. IMGN_8 TaxID=3136564 RepID=UPI003100E3C5